MKKAIVVFLDGTEQSFEGIEFDSYNKESNSVCLHGSGLYTVVQIPKDNVRFILFSRETPKVEIPNGN